MNLIKFIIVQYVPGTGALLRFFYDNERFPGLGNVMMTSTIENIESKLRISFHYQIFVATTKATININDEIFNPLAGLNSN